MEQALKNLFNLLNTEIFEMLNRSAVSYWYTRLIEFLNVLLNKIFDIFHDTASTEINQIITVPIANSILTFLVLIWFISILVKIFKLSFQTLKKVYLNIIETGPIEKGSSKTWRKQWRRKKWNL